MMLVRQPIGRLARPEEIAEGRGLSRQRQSFDPTLTGLYRNLVSQFRYFSIERINERQQRQSGSSTSALGPK
jgi:hypothetical protein